MQIIVNRRLRWKLIQACVSDDISVIRKWFRTFATGFNSCGEKFENLAFDRQKFKCCLTSDVSGYFYIRC